MDSGSITQIIVLVVLILFSGYFSATETAFSALNRIRIKNMASDGNKRAALVLNMAEKFDTILSTILIGNNIVKLSTVYPYDLFPRTGHVENIVCISK